MRTRQIAGELLRKEAGVAGDVARGSLAAAKGFLGSGKHISKVMAEHGVKSPAAHAAAKLTPYVAAGLGVQEVGKKIKRSPTYQKLRWKLEERKQRKAMERAQRGY
jgi:hypothetical protein